MDDKSFDKKLEMRHWQNTFNPTKTSEKSSVILKKNCEKEKNRSASNSEFAWC